MAKHATVPQQVEEIHIGKFQALRKHVVIIVFSSSFAQSCDKGEAVICYSRVLNTLRLRQ